MTAAEIFQTTGLDRTDSQRMAAELIDAPAIVVTSFRAMSSIGAYSVDEMIERLRAVRMMAK